MNYVIAIPTYKRYGIKTLEYLNRQSVPVGLITIFVANESEYKLYYEQWGSTYAIVIGVIGIGPQRNFITSFYPEGTYIVSMDDDIRDLYHMKGVGFNVWIQECLSYMVFSNIGLLGLNPTSNVYWRSISKAPTFQSGRYLAVGVFHIYRIKSCIPPLEFNFIEDYERSIKYLRLDGAVGRYNGVVLKHTNWTNGGLKEARTKDAYCKAVTEFASLYSNDVYLTMKRIPALSKTELLPNVRIRRTPMNTCLP
jgi:hypothetical protein